MLTQHGYRLQQAVDAYFAMQQDSHKAACVPTPVLEKLFAECTSEDALFEDDLIEYLDCIGIDPSSWNALVVFYMLDAAEPGELSRSEFVQGWQRHGCATLDDMKKTVSQKCSSLQPRSPEHHRLYKWLFSYLKQEGKSVDTSLARQIWELFFSPKQCPLLVPFCTFINPNETTSISRDVWDQTYDFLYDTQAAADYDLDGAWPCLMDEFILHEKQ